eukprot:88997-Pyramimonas_sp.AAC.1
MPLCILSAMHRCRSKRALLIAPFEPSDSIGAFGFEPLDSSRSTRMSPRYRCTAHTGCVPLISRPPSRSTEG